MESFFADDHGGGTQTWDMCHLGGGHSFFANNSGVLYFNSVEWQILYTPRRTIARSLVFVERDSLLYVGSQGEIGYFDLNQSPMVYTSLLDRMPERHRSFSDVWDMVVRDDILYFWSDRKVFRYDGEGFQILELPASINFMTVLGDQIALDQEGLGLFTLVEEESGLSVELRFASDANLMGAISLSDGRNLLLTEWQGIWTSDSTNYVPSPGFDEVLKDKRLRTVYYWRERGYVCVGTSLSGLFIFDEKGDLRYQIDRRKGLANNTVATLGSDGSGSLWLGSFIDIAQLTLDEQKGVLYPDGELQGAVYDVELWNGHYFFATSSGLYTLKARPHYDPRDAHFELIPGTEGECRGLDLVGRELFLSHDQGVYRIENKLSATPLYTKSGIWRVVSLGEDWMCGGGYDGLHLFKKEGSSWSYSHQVDSFAVSSRILAYVRPGELWVSHPYQGVYRVVWKDGFENTQISIEDRYPQLGQYTNCYGFSFDGHYIVTNRDSIFIYNRDQDRFEPEEMLIDMFRDEALLRLLEYDGQQYYIGRRTAGLIRRESGGVQEEYVKVPLFDSKDHFIGGFENLVLIEDVFFLCGDRGTTFRSTYGDEPLIELRLQSLSHGDSLLFSSLTDGPLSDMQLTSDIDHLRAQLWVSIPQGSTRDMDLKASLSYKGDLMPLSSEGLEVSMPNLNPGSYKLVCEIDYEGHKYTFEPVLAFKITSPWYWSLAARIIYTVLAIALTFGLSSIPAVIENRKKKKLLIEKEKIDSQYQRLKKEKKDAEISAMESDLTNATLHLLQKTELIDNLRKEINALSAKIKDTKIKKDLRAIENKLKDDKRIEEDWENFSKHFNRIHNDFLRNLKSEFPHLTANDLKLCAYLRLNLRTKEIAPLLGISVRGVEIGRYRLRKKLGLNKETNLNEFMISY